MKLKIVTRSGTILLDKVEIPHASSKISSITREIHKKFPKYHPNRQRLTYGSTHQLLDEEKTCSDYGLKEGDVILFKDLGPQITWRTVFLIEYLGPMLLHPIFYAFPNWIYGGTTSLQTRSPVQLVACGLIVFHYFKREMETLFIHRFSHGTMPLKNLFKNSFHYWITGGMFMAYFLYHPRFMSLIPNFWILIMALLFLFFEISNLRTHILLRNLRPPGSKMRKIPRGYGFNWISCPNYFFESMAWLCIAIMTHTFACFIFWLVSTIQMYIWALKKHQSYLREFPNYPKIRKSMFPFIA